MGQINKSLNDVHENTKNLLSQINTFKTTRKLKPEKTAESLQKLQIAARLTKASLKSFSSQFRSFLIGDIDNIIQEFEQDSFNLINAHKNMNVPQMEENLEKIESLEGKFPQLLKHMETIADIFSSYVEKRHV